MRLLRNKTKLNPNKNKLIWTFGGCLPLNLSWPPLPILQHTINIQRQTGGLGISIAGGKGSTPYKGDDEVRPDVSVILRKSDGLHIKSCVLFVCSGNLHLQGICRGSCSQSWGESGRQTPRGTLAYAFFLLPLFIVFLKQCMLFTFSGCFSGEWCGPPWGRTPHSCWSFAKLWCDSFYDGATGTYGGTRERHHHYAAEAGRRLLPTGETQQWPRLQPGANPQWTSAATHHLPDPKWQGAWIQHRRW